MPTGVVEEPVKKEKKQITEDLQLIAAILLAVLLMDLSGIGCPIKFLTGIPCAGCGMSRALLALCRADIRTAVQYHPLSVLMPAAFAAWIFRRHIPKRVFDALCFLLAGMFVLVYIFRMASGDPVLGINVENGFFIHIIKEVIYVLS
ncbi:MAG: DUF2752 domain-containing protein [Eubacteriales bacterium]|nr:DUF2752 domain-containing protein [Eubacteriales bacterium]